ncbi:unnamed protein product [Sphacelaria rigidula]
MNELFLITKPGQQTIVYPEMPLWGKYRVYNTPREAVDSIPQEILDQQCIRLVLVASNRQLRRLVKSGREACQPDAALYLEVSNTCPFYQLEWDTGWEGVVMGIRSKIPHNGPKDSYITAAIGGADGTQHAEIASVQESRERKGRLTAKQPIAITLGDLVVGGSGFEQRWLRARRATGQEGLEDEVAPDDDHDDCDTGSDGDGDDGGDCNSN